MLQKEEHCISSQWSRLCEDVDLHDLSIVLCHAHIGVLGNILFVDILLFDNPSKKKPFLAIHRVIFVVGDA